MSSFSKPFVTLIIQSPRCIAIIDFFELFTAFRYFLTRGDLCNKCYSCSCSLDLFFTLCSLFAVEHKQRSPHFVSCIVPNRCAVTLHDKNNHWGPSKNVVAEEICSATNLSFRDFICFFSESKAKLILREKFLFRLKHRSIYKFFSSSDAVHTPPFISWELAFLKLPTYGELHVAT